MSSIIGITRRDINELASMLGPMVAQLAHRAVNLVSAAYLARTLSRGAPMPGPPAACRRAAEKLAAEAEPFFNPGIELTDGCGPPWQKPYRASMQGKLLPLTKLTAVPNSLQALLRQRCSCLVLLLLEGCGWLRTGIRFTRGCTAPAHVLMWRGYKKHWVRRTECVIVNALLAARAHALMWPWCADVAGVSKRLCGAGSA